jgi:hypothetical protein
MAKMTNDEAHAKTLVICARLNAVSNLNKSSAALCQTAREGLDTNLLDARYALSKAESADFMHYFFTEMKLITENSVSYQTMINDPTSALYRG